MYPGMAKTARDEGFDEIADWFETLAKAEKSHAGKFQKTLESIRNQNFMVEFSFTIKIKFRCPKKEVQKHPQDTL